MDGKLLRDLRLRSRLTFRAMGAVINRSAPATFAYEKGERPIPVDVLVAWLDACNATDAERLAVLGECHASAPTTAGQKTPKARPLVPSIRRISKAALASTEARVRAQTAPRGEG